MTTDRLRLPNRRPSETFNLQCGGVRYVATVSRFPDGTLAEIFLGNGKCGSQADANARDSTVVASIAFQYGVPLDAIRKALVRDGRGVAATPLGVALDVVAGAQS
jgi:hypothetical protein